MNQLLNSRFLKEKGFLGPFSLTEALVTLCLCLLTYLVAMACEDWLGHDRLWSLSWAILVFILAFLSKILLKQQQPNWLASWLSYHFLQPKKDRFRVTMQRYPLIKATQNHQKN